MHAEWEELEMEELKIHCKIILEFWLTPKNTRGFDQLCLVFLVKELINFALETMSGKRHILQT